MWPRAQTSWRSPPPSVRLPTPTSLSIGTWNVNGIRARHAQLQEWMARECPDVVCLQEIKAAPDQVPSILFETEGYWYYWHGGKGYSGVALHVSRAWAPDRPAFDHPPFDFEHRIVTVTLGRLTVASVYVPNGGKDFPAKMAFLEELDRLAAAHNETGRLLVICGDLNVARTDRDVHPKERKPRAIGQLPEERALLERIVARGLVDVGRALDPDNDQLYTWWPPWRGLREKNVGWRLDYILASRPMADHATSCTSARTFGTSDHAPVVARFAMPPGICDADAS